MDIIINKEAEILGTIVNSLTIIVGSIIGLIVKNRMNERISNTIMSGLGLCVLYIGISGALKNENTLIMIISIAIVAFSWRNLCKKKDTLNI